MRLTSRLAVNEWEELKLTWSTEFCAEASLGKNVLDAECDGLGLESVFVPTFNGSDIGRVSTIAISDQAHGAEI